VYVRQLSLTNFRNYGRLELSLPERPTLFHGANAQGKTNLLEALYYLATTRSPQTNQDQQLINWEALDPDEPVIVARLAAQLETAKGARHIELRLIREQQRGQISFKRQALVDKRKVRLMDLLGTLRVVLFLPQDVQIITGSPRRRRRYVDVTLCQADRRYCRALSEYNKVLETRNALLRQIAESGMGTEMLPIYDEKLVRLGSQIFLDRAKFIADLSRKAQQIHYERLTDRRETLKLNYLPRLSDGRTNHGNGDVIQRSIEQGEWIAIQENIEAVAVRLEEQLRQVNQQDIAAGTTRVGPHRDDWRFWVSGRNLGDYGSRGQQRTAILALKLAEIEWMAEKTGETPVLLLDEVVAELDAHRRALLLEAVQGVSQALLTATDTGMLTQTFLDQANTMQIVEGNVSQDKKEATD
jgi:DNA replication and repair protein RecF